MSKPRLLDLYCGAGGASMGYARAGFDVTGVDIRPQPRYPFAFVRADALEVALDGFDVIHASPPCQAYSWSARRWRIPRPDLIGPTRERLMASGRPYVIENVIGAPLRDPIVLCGATFGLELIRHRLFESNVWLSPPPHEPHVGTVRGGTYVTVAGHGGESGPGRTTWAARAQAMGIHHMTKAELNEAIPPAYTEWLGMQLYRMVSRELVASA